MKITIKPAQKKAQILAEAMPLDIIRLTSNGYYAIVGFFNRDDVEKMCFFLGDGSYMKIPNSTSIEICSSAELTIREP